MLIVIFETETQWAQDTRLERRAASSQSMNISDEKNQTIPKSPQIFLAIVFPLQTLRT